MELLDNSAFEYHANVHDPAPNDWLMRMASGLPLPAVLDGRGKYVKVLSLSSLLRGGGVVGDEVRRAAVRRAVVEAVGIEHWAQFCLWGVPQALLVMGLLAAAYFVGRSPGSSRSSDVWTYILMGLLMIMGVYIHWRSLMFKRSRQVVEALIRIDICAACGYRLEGLSVETDGCKVCPECGAAWKVNGTESKC